MTGGQWNGSEKFRIFLLMELILTSQARKYNERRKRVTSVAATLRVYIIAGSTPYSNECLYSSLNGVRLSVTSSYCIYHCVLAAMITFTKYTRIRTFSRTKKVLATSLLCVRTIFSISANVGMLGDSVYIQTLTKQYFLLLSVSSTWFR